MTFDDLTAFLNEKAELYNNKIFIENDPIQIPHQYSLRQDIEISGFLTATISWGNRKSIIKSATKMMNWMDNAPHEFILNFTAKDIAKFQGLPVHRTFNDEDFTEFLLNLRRIYTDHSSLEPLFLLQEEEHNYYHALQRFRNNFFLNSPSHRSQKHISSTYKNSSSKRLMMFLRWMVRTDQKGVDFGLWKNLDPGKLSIPLDVHTGNISRKLQLVTRKQNDWKAVEELDSSVRKMDSADPAKYDFALFGLGVWGDF